MAKKFVKLSAGGGGGITPIVIPTGTLIVKFNYFQDWSVSAGNKIKFKPVVYTTAASWGGLTNTAKEKYEIGDWQTITCNVDGDYEYTETFTFELDASRVSNTSTSYTGFGILVDKSNSSYRGGLTAIFYPHKGETTLLSLDSILNGYKVYTGTYNSYGEVCGSAEASVTGASTTQTVHYQKASLGSNTIKKVISDYSMIIEVNYEETD